MSNTTIQLRKSGQTGNTPVDLAHGELAINYADGKLFYKNGVGIKAIENQKTFSTINANNSLVIATSPTDILSLEAGSNVLIDTNTVTKTVTISVPGGSSIDTLARDIATNAYNEANTQNVINQTQNTWITNTNTFAQAAFNSANAGVTLATAAYAQANTVPTQLQTAGIRTNASYFPLFVDSNNAVLTAESVYSTGAGITITPSTNTITATTFTGLSIIALGGTFSQFVELTGDDDYIEWGASNDARMMYNGPANTINLQLYSDVISFKIVDNANTADRFIFYKANGDLRLVTGNVIFSDGTVQRTEALTSAIAAYAQANSASSNTVYLQSINDLQNTNITSVNTFAGAAYDHSNTRFSSSGGTISGNVTIQNDLSVLGNVNFIGNVTSITVTGNSGQFFGYASNGHNALYAGIPIGYDFQPFTVFQASANHDGYSQINIQNINNGLDASSDLVATADNGTEDDTYIAAGIGSSQHADPEYTLLGPNDGYLYVSGNTTTTGGDLVIGTFLPQNDVIIAAGGMNTENEQMRIIGSSNTISIRANVNSSLAKSVLLGPVANVRITGGSSGQLLSTDGSGNLSFINSPVDLATAAYGKANAEGSINNTQNTNITNVNTFASSAFNSANAGVTLATAAYAQANTASGTSNNATYYGGYLEETFAYALRSGLNITGGGVISANSGSYINWTQRFIVISQGNGTATANSGYFDITVPAAGTTITGVGGASNVVVGTSGIPLANWQALYYILPIGSSNTSVAANFRIASYTTAVDIPAHWVLICVRNGDAGSGSCFKFTNGTTLYAGTTVDTAKSSTYSANVSYYANLTDVASGTYYPLMGLSDTGTIDISSNSRFTFTPSTGVFSATSFSGAGTGLTGTANMNITGTSGADATQNTNITNTNTLATAAYGKANAEGTINSTQNTNITSINTLATAAYGKANAEGTINSTQNTWITNTDTLARAAYTAANSATSTTQTSGIQTNASYFPIFVNSNNATATAETLNSHGSLAYNPSTGTLSATVFSATSDETLKENIKTIEDPINTIMQLRGVTYTWKNTKEESMGVIAQEVEKVLPMVVRETEKKKTVDYQNIIGLLIEAIKEQQKQINELKRKIDGTNNQ
jgi:hypothetical protein